MNSTLTAIKAHNLPPMRGNRLAVISRSGGHAVVAADAVAKYDFVLQPFPEDFLRMVESRLRAGVIRLGNPMDLGDLFDFDLFHQIVRDTLAREDIEGMLVVLNYNGIFFQEDSRSLAGKIKEICLQGEKPVALCLVTTGEEWQINRRNHPGFPMFTDPEDAAKALAISRDFYHRNVSSFEEAENFAVAQEKALAMLAEAKARQARQLSTAETFEILSNYSVPLAPWAQANSRQEAAMQAAALGFPVAMKVMGEEFVHKSDAGGVLLNLNTEAEASDGYDRLAAIIQTTEAKSKEKVTLVQKMVSEGYEVFVGAKQDPVFGPVILAGLGGVYVEVFGDVALRVAPVSAAEAQKMFAEIRGNQILKGVRGQPPGDLDALIDTVQRISQLVCDLPQIRELDLNPIKVLPRGQGCLVVDCRMVIS
jgi:acetyltransferase